MKFVKWSLKQFWMALFLLLVAGCSSEERAPTDLGTGGTGGEGEGTVGVELAKTMEQFSQESTFVSITCEGLKLACGISNENSLNLFACMWKRADFSNDSTQKEMTVDQRQPFTEGGSDPICLRVNRGREACSNLVTFPFGHVSRREKIWKNSPEDKKPVNPKALAASCGILVP